MYEGNNYGMDLLYCKDLNHKDDFRARCLNIENKGCQAGCEEFTETYNTKIRSLMRVL